MRLSFLWARTQHGFDLGVPVHERTSDFSGLARWAARAGDRQDGFGVAFSLVNIHSGSDSGVNGAFINLLHNTEHAFNTGFTIASGTTLVDLGGVNVSMRRRPRSIINVTKRIRASSSASSTWPRTDSYRFSPSSTSSAVIRGAGAPHFSPASQVALPPAPRG
jgi:hypothetical protein